MIFFGDDDCLLIPSELTSMPFAEVSPVLALTVLTAPVHRLPIQQPPSPIWMNLSISSIQHLGRPYVVYLGQHSRTIGG